MKQECAYGCDPNSVCRLVECGSAKEVAQCMANSCPLCFTEGFESDDCWSCLYYDADCESPTSCNSVELCL
ncbi:MAG: hypothetical protein JRH20_05260 [Deltaproteobacteria bacterium]|nr:hypothetical protein [Deltaproteobacteria bacterium]